MKKLHYLLVVGFFAILAGCAKDNLHSDITKQPAITSFTDLVDSDIDIKTWQSQNISHHPVNPNPAITTRSTDFTTDPLDCPDLPVEDFEEGIDALIAIGFPDPLDEFSNNEAFSPGEILPGVSLNTNIDRSGSELYIMPTASGFGNPTKLVGANFFVAYLIIDFSAEGVRNVSMKVFDFLGGGGVTVEVFGISGSIGSTVVASTQTGSQVSISTTEDIVQITISGGGFEGVDDLAFGTCVSYIIIDSCDSGVEDHEFEDGSTMMSLILECAENAGNHGEFVSCVAHLTNTWKKAGLITGAQKDAIMDCAGGADIP